MPDFNVRSDSVNVEQIMDQIRARIREKRGVDYTEQQIRELAAVKLEKFLDPRGVRSDLLEQFRKAQPAYAPPELPNFAFEGQTLYESTRPPLRWIRRLLNPILKLFFNPNPLIHALNIQARLNTMYGEREARREATRRAFDQLQYELMHNLVIETTRISIEVKNLKMQVESLAGRLEFNERRARALESVVAYKDSGDEHFETLPAAASSSSAVREPGPVVTPAAPSASREPQSRSDFNRGASQPSHSGQSPQGAREPQDRPDQSRVPVSPGQTPAPAGSGQPGEGPGQRSRRRRRRRGRRGGGGSAVSMMGGQGDASASPTAAPESTSSSSDQSTDFEPEEAASSSSEQDSAKESGSQSSTGSGSESSSSSGADPEPPARSGQDDPQ